MAIFQNVKNQSKERLFLQFNYQDKRQGPLEQTVWFKTERRAVLKGELMACLQEPLIQAIYLLGIRSKVPAKGNMNYKFESGRQRTQDLPDATTNGTLWVFSQTYSYVTDI